MAQQSSDSRKEEFRKFLEKKGAVDALTHALVELYEATTKPDDVIGFIQSALVAQQQQQQQGGGGEAAKTGAPDSAEVQKLKEENAQLKERVAALEKELANKA